MLFEEFPKIARLSRNCVITEKIDGTNAQIFWDPLMLSQEHYESEHGVPALYTYIGEQKVALWIGSRNRWIYPEKSRDNSGFARWAVDHMEDLKGLGFGRHYGEWWGQGIQRGYGLKEKKFSLFNVGVWKTVASDAPDLTPAPACCGVVPILYQGIFSTTAVELCIEKLRQGGSVAAPGFTNPEGVVIWHEAARILFKKTLEKDEQPKSFPR